MSTHGAFPTTQEELNTYFGIVIPYLNVPENTARFNISATNLAAVNTLYSNPNVPPVTVPDNLGYVELWALHNNPSTTNKVITDLLNKRIRQHLPTDPVGIENVLRVIYNDIPASVLTATDRKTLNLPLRKAKTTHHVATQNKITWTTVGIGGGDVLSKCQPSGPAQLNPQAATQKGKGKANRPHKETGYEIRTSYMILKQGATLPTDPNAPGMTQVVDTRARTVRHLGAINAGNVLCEFKQWHNPKNPNLDGPWSGPQTCIIT